MRFEGLGQRWGQRGLELLAFEDVESALLLMASNESSHSLPR